MIGVFDSGIGGLTVLKEFLRVLPEYDYVYLGDNKRAPYGDKSEKEIYRYAREAVDFLFSKKCQLIIVACNTVSASALRKIQKEYLPEKYPGKKVLGVIIPTIEEVARLGHERVGLIGTKATIRSGKYQKESDKLNEKIKIFGQACPKLVPAIERGMIDGKEMEALVKSYIQPLKDKKINSLILGCTHYPLAIGTIKKVSGKKIKIVDPSGIIGTKLEAYLERHPEIAGKLSRRRRRIYFTTGDTGSFGIIGSIFLERKILKVNKARLKPSALQGGIRHEKTA